MTTTIEQEKIFLCHKDDLNLTGAKTIEVAGEPETIIVVSNEDQIYGYRSQCPHMGVPLETFPDMVLDESKQHLVCSSHGAKFSKTTGECVFGPCRGAFLEKRELNVTEGQIYLVA